MTPIQERRAARGMADPLNRMRAIMAASTAPPIVEIPPLADMLAEIRAKRAERDALAVALCQTAEPLRMQHQDGRRAAITPKFYGGPGWRITWLDGRGPSGHTDFSDKLAAVSEALLYKFKPMEA
jgi:hypothetical protein